MGIECWGAPGLFINFRMARLLGRNVREAAEHPEVAEVFLASHAFERREGDPFCELRHELAVDKIKAGLVQLRRNGMVPIPARSREEGRARLIGIIDRAASRLREMLGEHSKRVDREAEKAVLEEEYDRSPEGQRLKRQEMDYLRQLKRAIATDRGFRRESAAWNETRRPENETR